MHFSSHGVFTLGAKSNICFKTASKTTRDVFFTAQWVKMQNCWGTLRVKYYLMAPEICVQLVELVASLELGKAVTAARFIHGNKQNARTHFQLPLL